MFSKQTVLEECNVVGPVHNVADPVHNVVGPVHKAVGPVHKVVGPVHFASARRDRLRLARRPVGVGLVYPPRPPVCGIGRSTGGGGVMAPVCF